MTVRIGINGFGRIGRNYLRAARSIGRGRRGGGGQRPHLGGDPRPPPPLRLDPRAVRQRRRRWSTRSIVLDTGPIAVLAERDPKALPWDDLGVDVVIESTGLFTTRESAGAHLEAGATRVIISAPATDVDATFVVGVNDDEFDPAKDFVVSNASCTTNCFVPMVKVLDDAFGVESGTDDHGPRLHQRPEPARPARTRTCAGPGPRPINIVPASTGAARATGLVLAVDEGPARRQPPCGCRCRTGRSPTSPR